MSYKTIDLASGGTVTVVIDANVFRLNVEDQEFVLGLVKSVTDYEAAGGSLKDTQPTEEPK